MARHNQTGKDGEAMAAEYLSGLDYRILYKNWRHRHLEVDLIAEKKSMLHFIEVKTRRNLNFGHPEENVSKKKMQHLIKAAAAFLFLQPQWKRIQFDILSITLLQGKPDEYFLIEDVYLW